MLEKCWYIDYSKRITIDYIQIGINNIEKAYIIKIKFNCKKIQYGDGKVLFFIGQGLESIFWFSDFFNIIYITLQ